MLGKSHALGKMLNLLLWKKPKNVIDLKIQNILIQLFY
jgi:hypothetical protein